MSIINISNLTFSYDGSDDLIFDNLSLCLDTDWKLGLIGRNGKGKTTFLKLLTSMYEYQGSITASVKFVYFPFDISNKTELCCEIARQISGVQNWMIEYEIAKFGLESEILSRPFCQLSGGEQTKFLLSILFLKDNAFLLIDEPTNHLDAEARQIVAEYLNMKTGFIIVSHDRALIDMCCDHILSINRTDIEIQKGNFSSWHMNKINNDKYEINQNNRLVKEIRSLSASAKRAAVWSDKTEKSKYGQGVPDTGYIGHKSAKMMKRARNIEKRKQNSINEKSKLLKNIELTEELKINYIPYIKNRLISARNLSVIYDGDRVFENITFDINEGERILLIGSNGSGKTSLLRLINGENIDYVGELYISRGLIISYIPQDTSFLSGSLKMFAENRGLDESLFKAILRKLDFTREQFNRRMEGFSMGQKKKVLLADSLCKKAHLYIWDEPLNYIDVFTRIQIEGMIKDSGAALLFTEHDVSFTANIAHKHILLSKYT